MKLHSSIAAIVIGQIIIGVASQILLIRFVGVGLDTDAIVAAQALVGVITGITSSVLQSIWQPAFAKSSDNKKMLDVELSKSLSQSVVLCSIFFALIFLLAANIIDYVFPDFAISQKGDVEIYIYLFGASSVLAVLANQMILYLKAKSDFVRSEFIGLASSFLFIFFLPLIVPMYGAISFAVLFLIKSIVHFGVLFWICGSPKVLLNGSVFDRKLWNGMLPMVASNGIGKLSPLFDRFLVGLTGEGSLTVFNLAMLLAGSISTVMERSISSPIASKVGMLVSSLNYLGLMREIKKVIICTMVMAFLIAVALFVFSSFLSSLIAVVLDVDQSYTKSILNLTLILMFYVFASSAGTVLTATLFSQGKYYTFLRISILGVIFGCVIKYICYLNFSLEGVVAGVSGYYMFNFLFFLYILKRTDRQRHYA